MKQTKFSAGLQLSSIHPLDKVCRYATIIVGMKYLTILRKTAYGYDVHVPALPGCHSQGDTVEEALENIQDAILTYLEIEAEELEGVQMREVEVAFA